MQKQNELIRKINALGKKRTPFLLLVDFLMNEPVLFLTDELEQENIQLQFPTFRTKEKEVYTNTISLKKHPISFEHYKLQFEMVKQHLQYGNSFLTNLTCQTPIETDLSLQQIYNAAKAKYKIKYKDLWVCFSPESFITIENAMIRSFPMKGTIDASIPNAKEVLLSDEKEIAEHYTIVDLIRNDLSRVAENVQVKKFRYLDRIDTHEKSLYQVSSQIEGELSEKYQDELGTLLFSLLPAGSISGAPKTKTIDIILEAENYNRGFYTGTAFYYDGQNIDSCVLIRFIEQKEDGLVYKSGGGITIHSEAEKEYQELIDKIYVPTV